VLLIVALEGMLAPLLNLSEKRDFLFSKGFGPLLMAAMLATLPATAVLTMLVHGRLLCWTGRLLKGSARPFEVHAAFAWSQLPFVLAAWPLLLELPLRLAAADAEPVPAWLERAIEWSEPLAEWVGLVAALAAVAAAVRWIQFLAEAQRFSAWRAIANQLMAGLLLLGLLAAGIALAAAALPQSNAIVYGAIGSALVLLAVGIPALIGRVQARAV
jgi:hypothetical protein